MFIYLSQVTESKPHGYLVRFCSPHIGSPHFPLCIIPAVLRYLLLALAVAALHFSVVFRSCSGVTALYISLSFIFLSFFPSFPLPLFHFNICLISSLSVSFLPFISSSHHFTLLNFLCPRFCLFSFHSSSPLTLCLPPSIFPSFLFSLTHSFSLYFFFFSLSVSPVITISTFFFFNPCCLPYLNLPTPSLFYFCSLSIFP